MNSLFPVAEYLDRVERVKRTMEASGIELLLVSEPANMAYLSGFRQTAYYHRQFVIVAIGDAQPLWVGREFTDLPTARLTTFMDADRLVGYSEHMASHAALDFADDMDPMVFVARLIEERGWPHATIGLELNSRTVPFAAGDSFRRRLPAARMVDASSLVGEARVIKSSAEITYLREAGVIADEAMAAGIANVQVGLRQCDAASAIFAKLVAGTPEAGGHYPEGVVLTSGDQVPAIHGLWSDRVFMAGEMTNLELAGCRHGYNTAITRSVFLGTPSRFETDLAGRVLAGIDEAIAAAVPGETCDAVAARFEESLAGGSYQARPWLGYSIGIGYPGMGWTDSATSIKRGDLTVLQPNMVFHLVPCVLFEDGQWGMVSSQTFRIAERGPPEELTRSPRDIVIR